jgi:formate dehydrogenase major subunit
VWGLGATARSSVTSALSARTTTADASVRSVCPYCAVGCGQVVSVRDGRITNIEGDLSSPISRGRLCPKGSATFQLVTGSYRQDRVLYRRPGGVEWEPLPLEEAMDMVAARVRAARDASWDPVNRRTLAFAHLGGATLDNEENYLIKKLFTALGAIQIENQARI